MSEEKVNHATAANLEAHVALKQQEEARKLKGAVVDHWYKLKPGSNGKSKVVEHKRYEDGRVSSVYLGRESEMLAQVNEWRKQGLLRA